MVCRVTTNIKFTGTHLLVPIYWYPFAGTHLYTWVDRGTVRVECLALEQNSVPLQGLNPELFSVVKHSNHETTTPPQIKRAPQNK